MLERLRSQRLLDLRPPIAPAFERDEVLPDGEMVLASKVLAQRCGGIRPRPLWNRI